MNEKLEAELVCEMLKLEQDISAAIVPLIDAWRSENNAIIAAISVPMIDVSTFDKRDTVLGKVEVRLLGECEFGEEDELEQEAIPSSPAVILATREHILDLLEGCRVDPPGCDSYNQCPVCGKSGYGATDIVHSETCWLGKALGDPS